VGRRSFWQASRMPLVCNSTNSGGPPNDPHSMHTEWAIALSASNCDRKARASQGFFGP